MGFQVTETDGELWLSLEGEAHRFSLASDGVDVVKSAESLLESLVEAEAARGRVLAEKRRALGFATVTHFAEVTGLDANMLYEAEEGLVSPLPVHERILDWLETGRLSLTA